MVAVPTLPSVWKGFSTPVHDLLIRVWNILPLQFLLKCHCGLLNLFPANIPTWEHDFFLTFYRFYGEIDVFYHFFLAETYCLISIGWREAYSFIVLHFSFRNVAKKTTKSF